MSRMLNAAMTEEEIEDIKRRRLIGVEQQATMYALAASNMILRGDGKRICIKDRALIRQLRAR